MRTKMYEVILYNFSVHNLCNIKKPIHFSALGKTDDSIDLTQTYQGECIQDSKYRFLSDHIYKSPGLFQKHTRIITLRFKVLFGLSSLCSNFFLLMTQKALLKH